MKDLIGQDAQNPYFTINLEDSNTHSIYEMLRRTSGYNTTNQTIQTNKFAGSSFSNRGLKNLRNKK